MEKHSYSNALSRAFLILEDHNVDSEVANYLMCELLNWSPSKLSIHKNDLMDDSSYNQFMKMIEQAKENIPPQYILGKAWFYGREFKVTTKTLIPRQETEELVNKVISDLEDAKDLSILDIGTGSGNIAVTLALETNQEVTAIDIDADTLEIAKENATNLDAKVEFLKSDLFDNVDQKFDVIVSNPPYISEEEIKDMDKSVLEYEPLKALFADDNGLAVYKKIFTQISDYLNPSGVAYFEYGFQQKEVLSEYISKHLPEFAVEFYRDMSGNWRYLKMYRKND
ncbi:peptide chain release factor N(5)-glutamine methyltransferase [Lactobacillus sp. YT155]|uniref:peptide chain release factor N(5)-glutamine methyltransferase n=1 Tax=Lactobacillus sp. YT155 TaxID=3060955 RepID=UPI00265E6AB3|nr:peptide chain release factor N(5)-glutamine methyltransferase [Lactobacillus sp. YT155]MDO1605002.1 peptide chain release factor N(5)-glutamine methyltransferase [Lactobacillus sp. YT155]